jgi:hypothetical protein
MLLSCVVLSYAYDFRNDVQTMQFEIKIRFMQKSNKKYSNNSPIATKSKSK